MATTAGAPASDEAADGDERRAPEHAAGDADKSAWAPPRRVLHFDMPQRACNKRCYGCGAALALAPDGAPAPGKVRFCEYTQRHFCTGCHHNKHFYIPAQVLRHWDFRQYLVSDFAFDFLESIYSEPCLDIGTLARDLFHNVPVLADVRLIRLQLEHLYGFISACPTTSHDLLNPPHVPSHLIHTPDMYSLHDTVELQLVKNLLQEVVESWCTHVATCAGCRARGTRCAICHSPKVIYPFMLRVAVACERCHTLFHRDCLLGSLECPQCKRNHAAASQ
eukprot:TRINITY_DN1139_c0_g1_i2.p1 TRINITY_DN1139_c0_g1~~TRINITY_DN1139_c0_g1_i2.p1  ORF type:complete len:287 (+),score=76.34 TRINITY_DN1139_c0_g1_i2:29-862(+)